MAERVPTTMGASPRWMRRHCSLRSSGVSAECSSATRAPNAASSRPAICGVRPISGTRRIEACRGRARAAWRRDRLRSCRSPVTPWSRKGWNAPRPRAMEASASVWDSFSGGAARRPRFRRDERPPRVLRCAPGPRRTSVCRVTRAGPFCAARLGAFRRHRPRAPRGSPAAFR